MRSTSELPRASLRARPGQQIWFASRWLLLGLLTLMAPMAPLLMYDGWYAGLAGGLGGLCQSFGAPLEGLMASAVLTGWEFFLLGTGIGVSFAVGVFFGLAARVLASWPTI